MPPEGSWCWSLATGTWLSTRWLGLPSPVRDSCVRCQEAGRGLPAHEFQSPVSYFIPHPPTAFTASLLLGWGLNVPVIQSGARCTLLQLPLADHITTSPLVSSASAPGNLNGFSLLEWHQLRGPFLEVPLLGMSLDKAKTVPQTHLTPPVQPQSS